MTKHTYFKNLDGLRFLSFLSVFFYHRFYTTSNEIKTSKIYHFVKIDLFGNGNLGVNFFFVLSGFLITFLLIEEKNNYGQIDIKKFWVRRVLRIWPLFYFMVFFGFIIFPWIKNFFGLVSTETASPLYYVTFLNNFDFINKGLPDASSLGVLWSIAIEEQFYLFWPLIIFIFPVKKLWIPFLIITISSLVFRAMNDSSLTHEVHTMSCIGDMTTGALGAWLIGYSIKFKNYIERLKRFQILLIYVLFGFIYLFRDNFLFLNYGVRIFERMFIAIVIIHIILEQSFSINSLFKISNFKRISDFGKITYGLYCLHFIGILITITITNYFNMNKNLFEIIFLTTPLALLFSILISKVSYIYYETPFLKLKEKYTP